MTEKSAADRVLELDEKATGEPWYLFNRRRTLQISSSTDHGHHDAIVFWSGFEASDLPHRKQVANAKLIQEYRQLAPALARQVKALEAERIQLQGILKAAKCPNNECDGNGVIFGVTDIEPCQWCYEREKLLK